MNFIYVGQKVNKPQWRYVTSIPCGGFWWNMWFHHVIYCPSIFLPSILQPPPGNSDLCLAATLHISVTVCIYRVSAVASRQSLIVVANGFAQTEGEVETLPLLKTCPLWRRHRRRLRDTDISVNWMSSWERRDTRSFVCCQRKKRRKRCGSSQRGVSGCGSLTPFCGETRGSTRWTSHITGQLSHQPLEWYSHTGTICWPETVTSWSWEGAASPVLQSCVKITGCELDVNFHDTSNNLIYGLLWEIPANVINDISEFL